MQERLRERTWDEISNQETIIDVIRTAIETYHPVFKSQRTRCLSAAAPVEGWWIIGAAIGGRCTLIWDVGSSPGRWYAAGDSVILILMPEADCLMSTEGDTAGPFIEQKNKVLIPGSLLSTVNWRFKAQWGVQQEKPSTGRRNSLQIDKLLPICYPERGFVLEVINITTRANLNNRNS
jgi:hypothetical protein